jgi:hypothetical protein
MDQSATPSSYCATYFSANATVNSTACPFSNETVPGTTIRTYRLLFENLVPNTQYTYVLV